MNAITSRAAPELASPVTFLDHLREAFAILTDFLAARDAVPDRVGALILLGNDFLETVTTGVSIAARVRVDTVVFSGGRGRLTPASWKSEATEFARAWKAGNGSASVMLVEEKSTNTGENLHFSKSLLDEAHADTSAIVVVQYPPLQKRATETARFVFGTAAAVYGFAAFQPSFDCPLGNWELGAWRKRLLMDSVGEILRLLCYSKPSRGFFAPVAVPEPARDACRHVYGELLREPTISEDQKLAFRDLVREAGLGWS